MVCGALLALLALWPSQVRASDAAGQLQKHWSGGSLAQGVGELRAMTIHAPRDAEARLALGVAQMARTFETLAQGLRRHGVDARAVASVFGVDIGLALHNPDPQGIDARGVRLLLVNFVRDLDEARTTLAGVTDPDVKIVLNVASLRLDLDADGRADPEPTAAQRQAFLTAMLGMPGRDAPTDESGALAWGEFVIGIDLADARWLEGYANLIAAPVDFLLAHDLEAFTNTIGHRFFPKAGFPLQRTETADNADKQFTGADTLFADAIAAIHTFHGKQIEPQRRLRTRARLLDVIALSRETMALIAQESDDDHEWLPNPRQTNRFADGLNDFAMTQTRIDGWLAVLKTTEDVLEGRLLLPHWRFKQGVDVKAFFEGREPLDVVLLLTGSGALPYLRDGPVLDNARLEALGRPFGGNFFLFAVWFN